MTSRADTFSAWANERTAPAERILAFETWVFGKLAEHLQWPIDTAARERAIGQARAFVCRAVADLGNHGFLFQPRELARLIEEKLKDLGRRQRAGEIEHIYPYLRSTWEGYVRRESDRLREQAMSLGCHIQQLQDRLLASDFGSAPPAAPTIPELMQALAAARRSRRTPRS